MASNRRCGAATLNLRVGAESKALALFLLWCSAMKLNLPPVFDVRPAEMPTLPGTEPAPPRAPDAAPFMNIPAFIPFPKPGAPAEPPPGAFRLVQSDPAAISAQLHAAVPPRGAPLPTGNPDAWIEEHTHFRQRDPVSGQRAVDAATRFVSGSTPEALRALSPDAREGLEMALNEGGLAAQRGGPEWDWARRDEAKIRAAQARLQGPPAAAEPQPTLNQSMARSWLSNFDVLEAEALKGSPPNAEHLRLIEEGRRLLRTAQEKLQRSDELPPEATRGGAIMDALIKHYPAPWQQPIR